MKLNFKARWVLPLTFFAAISCGKKTEEAVDPSSTEESPVEAVVEAIKDEVVPEIKASVSVDERASRLGFAKYLPADTEMVFSVYNSKQASEQLKALKLYELFEKQMGNVPGVLQAPEVAPIQDGGEDGVIEPEGGPNPWTLLGQEVTLAMGNSSGEQLSHLMTVNSRMGFFQAKAFGSAAHSFAKNGDMQEFSEKLNEEMGEGLMMNLLNDSESGMELLEKMSLPTIYVAFRANEGELDQAAQLVASSMAIFGMAGEMAAPIEIESAGGKLVGYKLLGEKIAETMKEERESIEEDLGAEATDALLAAVSKKNLIMVSGTIDDYVVLMIGGDEDSMQLVEEAKDSIVGTSELNFTDSYSDKQLLTVAYGEKEMLETLIDGAGGISSYALGLREGIASGDAMGNTRDIEEMLQLITEREKVLLSMTSAVDAGMVAYVEDGLKIESFGGYDKGSIDWDAKRQLEHLGDNENNLMFLNVASAAEYDENLNDYVEVIFESVYAMTMKLSAIEADVPELEEMKAYVQLFNDKFREDTLGIYEAFSGDFSDGLGQEVALVVDLQGSMPAIPGVPQEVVDGGKAPRATFIVPVTDREKLQSSWGAINTHLTSLLATASDMTGQKMPMQKPISSEKDGMTTWFVSFPFFQDDFLPSVTVSDEWFAASTSKTHAIDTIGKASEGGKTGEGVNFYINFKALTAYADEMMTMVEENADAIFPSEGKLEMFNRDKEMMKEFIKAAGEFESMTWSSKKEGGYVKNSIHFSMD
ncbi:MAG: hypothetical protein AB8D78_01195 [Akkermansiaceae bacterium]